MYLATLNESGPSPRPSVPVALRQFSAARLSPRRDHTGSQVSEITEDRGVREEFFVADSGECFPVMGRPVYGADTASNSLPVLDNTWIANPERCRLPEHRTPTGASWINQIEIWFGLITRQAIRRGTFSSVKQLIATIKNYIDNWNSTCQPFAWTADANTILAKVRWIESEVRKLTRH